MPRAILEFDLPEEQNEFENAVHAAEWRSILWVLLEDYLRPIWKHGEDEQKAEWAEQMRDEIIRLMSVAGVQFE